MSRMKIGLMFVNSGPFSSPALLAHLARTAEQTGVESLWTVEHVVVPQDYKSAYPYSPSGKMPGGEEVPIPDPLMALAYVAGLTSKIKLGTGVIILPQRHPLYLAKEVATLDQYSDARVLLGIGSGWLKEEFDALGVDFHARGARTDEAIRCLRALWGGGAATFSGRHFKFDKVKSYPKPVQKGGVPIHVGGHSPAAARRAGRLGDGFFPALADPGKLKELFGLMTAEAKKAGRDAARIELSCMGRANLDQIKALGETGVSRVVVPPPAFDTDGLSRGLEKIGNEIIAKL